MSAVRGVGATAAADAGYNLHDILADIPLTTVTRSTINDPAAFTARAVDRVVEHLRSGAPTASQRAATQRDKQTHLAQLRAHATDILGDTWSTRPELVTAVTRAPAFDALAAAMGRYGDDGLDLRELLARLPVLRIDRDDVRDKAAYTTYALHRIADQQVRASDAERTRVTANIERDAVLRSAAAVLRQAWSDDPFSATRVIDGPVFDILADRMATAADNGHDVPAVLAQLNPAALTAATAPPGATIIAFGRAIAAERHATTPSDPTHRQPAARTRRPRSAAPNVKPSRTTNVIPPSPTSGPVSSTRQSTGLSRRPTTSHQTQPSPNRNRNPNPRTSPSQPAPGSTRPASHTGQPAHTAH